MCAHMLLANVACDLCIVASSLFQSMVLNTRNGVNIDHRYIDICTQQQRLSRKMCKYDRTRKYKVDILEFLKFFYVKTLRSKRNSRYGWCYETVGGSSTPYRYEDDALVAENGPFGN